MQAPKYNKNKPSPVSVSKNEASKEKAEIKAILERIVKIVQSEDKAKKAAGILEEWLKKSEKQSKT
jgi:hypothetical protein